MSRIKQLAAVALAAATLGAGALVAPPTASAAMSCEQALEVASYWIALGDIERQNGNYSTATAWYSRASGLLAGAC